jgi:hypothetical protein
LPGAAYNLFFREMKPNGRSGAVTKVVTVKPGEVRELGELKVTPPER